MKPVCELQWGRLRVQQKKGSPGHKHLLDGVLNSHKHLPPDWMAEMTHKRH